MNLFNLFIIAAICLVLVIIISTLIIAVSGSTEVGGRIRQRLAARLKELPIYRLLQRRKINVDFFIAETSTEELEKEVKNCEACPSLRQCEEALTQPTSEKSDYTFCPNDPVLSEMERKAVKH